MHISISSIIRDNKRTPIDNTGVVFYRRDHKRQHAVLHNNNILTWTYVHVSKRSFLFFFYFFLYQLIYLTGTHLARSNGASTLGERPDGEQHGEPEIRSLLGLAGRQAHFARLVTTGSRDEWKPGAYVCVAVRGVARDTVWCVCTGASPRGRACA